MRNMCLNHCVMMTIEWTMFCYLCFQDLLLFLSAHTCNATCMEWYTILHAQKKKENESYREAEKDSSLAMQSAIYSPLPRRRFRSRTLTKWKNNLIRQWLVDLTRTFWPWIECCSWIGRAKMRKWVMWIIEEKEWLVIYHPLNGFFHMLALEWSVFFYSVHIYSVASLQCGRGHLGAISFERNK